MMLRDRIVESLPSFKQALLTSFESSPDVLYRAQSTNPWFVPEFSKQAIAAIADQFLDQTLYSNWISRYSVASHEKKVGLILAGNLPLVGFHDVLCVLSAGHQAIIRCSDKDAVLLPWLIDQWSEIVPEIKDKVVFADRMTGIDAAIATGSDNSSRYFEYYFRAIPHILRKHRNGVAVLNGQESEDEMKALASDIFMYFGLGCRSVSRLYVPEGYDFSSWPSYLSEWKHLEDHHKYKNNLDYNLAIYIINSVPHIQLGHLILREDEAIASRIGTVHYTFYQDSDDLHQHLITHQDKIQCIVSRESFPGSEHIHFGASQRPALGQYADGVDTMTFLSNL